MAYPPRFLAEQSTVKTKCIDDERRGGRNKSRVGGYTIRTINLDFIPATAMLCMVSILIELGLGFTTMPLEHYSRACRASSTRP